MHHQSDNRFTDNDHGLTVNRLSDACFTQVSEYFVRHAELKLSSGQLQYPAVDEHEPPG